MTTNNHDEMGPVDQARARFTRHRERVLEIAEMPDEGMSHCVCKSAFIYMKEMESAIETVGKYLHEQLIDDSGDVAESYRVGWQSGRSCLALVAMELLKGYPLELEDSAETPQHVCDDSCKGVPHGG